MLFWVYPHWNYLAAGQQVDSAVGISLLLLSLVNVIQFQVDNPVLVLYAAAFWNSSKTWIPLFQPAHDLALYAAEFWNSSKTWIPLFQPAHDF